MRRSGASFGGPYDIRSQSFEQLLDKYDELTKAIEALREELLRETYAAVPASPDASVRGTLLAISRAVFKRRRVTAEQMNCLRPLLADKVVRYMALVETQASLLESNRRAVFRELRTQLAGILGDPKFQTALNYSCPWLTGRFSRASSQSLTDFSNEERGVYAYAVKFFSKANPFHTFASVGFPPASTLGGVAGCEIVVNTSVIAAIERALLRVVQDPHRRLLYLCSYAQRDNVLQFITTLDNGVRFVSIKKGDFVDAVLRFFGDRRGTHSWAACTEYLGSALPHAEARHIEAQLALLVRHGVVVEYLVRDFGEFGCDLAGIENDYDEAVSQLQKIHLALIPIDKLASIHKQVHDLRLPMVEAEENSFFVNTYHTEITRQQEELAEQCLDSLRALKPFCAIAHNFSERAAVIHNYLVDRCESAPNGTMSYLDVVRDFLHNPSEIVRLYHPSVRSPELLESLTLWTHRLRSCSGRLQVQEAAKLLSQCPCEPKDVSLCFNGPADFVERMFFPMNIFAGDGRYISRYMLRRSRGRHRRDPSQDWIDVQLVVPSHANRMYIAPEFSAGCSFDKRFVHQFEQWIDPTDIYVQSVNGRVSYRHRPSSLSLRFHFFGFLLAEHLPTQYQLLLCNHADVYRNPFAVGGRVSHDPNEVCHEAPLYCGTVCWRRERWRVGARTLEAALSRSDILDATIRLRHLVHDLTASRLDHWYFQTLNEKGYASKPRYLDIRNPLSVHTFRRDVSRPHCSRINLSPMAPPVSHLSGDQDSHMTELMIEV